jgi:predicted transcriptional regulator
MARLTFKQRKKLPRSTFATPPTKAAKKKGLKGSYPIPDRAHARNALARVAQFGTPAQKAAVRAKVRAKFPDIGRGRTRS